LTKWDRSTLLYIFCIISVKWLEEESYPYDYAMVNWLLDFIYFPHIHRNIQTLCFMESLAVRTYQQQTRDWLSQSFDGFLNCITLDDHAMNQAILTIVSDEYQIPTGVPVLFCVILTGTRPFHLNSVGSSLKRICTYTSTYVFHFMYKWPNQRIG
jgi:hypothetical protein